MMVYDSPTVETTAEPMKQFGAPEVKDFASAQLQEQGAAVTKVGNAVTRIAQDLQDQIDTATTKDMDNRFADFLQKTLYDPERGYLQTSGKTALESRSGAIKTIQEAARSFEKGLTNDTQRYMFNKVASQRLQSAMLHIDSHAMDQAKVYEDGMSKARIDGFGQDMLSNVFGWKDAGGTYAISKTGMISEVRQFAAGQGWSPEQTQQAEQTALSQVVGNAVSRMISMGYSKDAKEYFDAANKAGEIRPDKLDEIQKMVNAATAETEGVQAAQSVWKRVMGDNPDINAPVKNADMFNLLQSNTALLENKPVYEAAKEALHLQISAHNAQQAEMNQSGEDSAWSMFSAGKTLAQIKASPSWRMMGGERQGRFESTHQAIQAARASQAVANEARNDRYLLRKNGALFFQDQNLDRLEKTSEAEIIAKMPLYGFDGVQHLLNMKRALSKPGSAEHLSVISTTEQVSRAAKKAGILPYTGAVSKSQQVNYADFEVEVQKRVKFYENTTLQGKRKANGDELQSVIDNVLINTVRLDKAGFDPEVPIYTVDPQDMKTAYVTINGKPEMLRNVPTGQRIMIIEGLQKRGLPVTEKGIMELWIQRGRLK